ncbi:MAG: tRNA (guanosine(46)-N7)-methyltransferase TrmB [Woeseia sp.]
MSRELGDSPRDHTRRSVRSFVRRAGRITTAQRRAIERLWPRFGVDFSAVPLDLDELFGRRARRVLEIGFGNGESLVLQAAQNPAFDYLGIDVHRPGIGHCLLHAEAKGACNLRLICHDAVEVLQQQIEDGSLSRLNLYFPDPWPKKRHHKRRLVQSGFLDLVASKLVAGGAFCVATDWQNYAEHIDAVVLANKSFSVHERREHGGEQPLDRPTTKFECRGLARGHKITEWGLVRI